MMTVADVVSSFTSTDDLGNVIAFNTVEFLNLVNALNQIKSSFEEPKQKKAKKVVKVVKTSKTDEPKTDKSTAKEAKTVPAYAKEKKEFYDSLPLGAEFKYRTAKGDLMFAKKIESKSKSGITAACELVGKSISMAKTSNLRRYPKFAQIELD